MSSDIARQWYVPAEVSALRLWLIIASCVTGVLAVIDWLRNDSFSLKISLVCALCLLLLRYVLPDGDNKYKRDATLGCAGLTLIFGIVKFGAGDRMLIDLWATFWVLLPAGLTLWWISSPEISSWAKGRITQVQAEFGLARNKIVKNRIEIIGSHALLLHAVLLIFLPVLWILNVAMSPGNILGADMDLSQWEFKHHFSNQLDPESEFWIWTRNSLVISIGTTLLGLALAIPAGYAFSRFKFRGREQAMFSFLLVQMFPGIIILVPYYLVMKTLGLLNTSMGLILAYSVTALPLCVWMLKGFFDTVPRELEEAALLDGCSQAQVFRRVILPLSLPAVAVTALFSFLAAWNEYLLALTFMSDNEKFTLPVGLASMIMSKNPMWGDFAAASLLVSIPVVILFIVFQRFLIEGLSAGSVKG
ncbi:MAG: sugar ABC transporter permease [Candidatus Thalassarchaeaceae archaeon]|nr:sugar ABC transporter permease [Candidatus Thalassarchaeaceae archaeon]